MDWNNILIIAQKEFKDALYNKWLILYALAFGFLILAVVWLNSSGSGVYGAIDFGRNTTSLINLVILIVPLMGLTLGAISVAAEREKGTLLYILAQPVSKIEVLLGKYFGLATSLIGALTIGFGISGLLIAFKGGINEISGYLLFIGFTFLLALISLSLGFLVSTLTRKSATAFGLAIFLWLSLVFFSDLGLMGTAIVLKIQVRELLFISLINPLQVFKMASMLVLKNNLDVLGPGGIYAIRFFGEVLLSVLISMMVALSLLPILASYLIIQKKGDM
ncbi:MAG TPA: ABC transporter permease subunit [Dehalococcoidia bacterium]|jgi:Cu-processing system permease protein|nr:ABC transporter permease subunit [Dehalococcoidia bacterium]